MEQNKKLDLLKKSIFEERLRDVSWDVFVVTLKSYEIQTIDDLLNLKLEVIKKTADKPNNRLPVELKNFLYDESNESMILDGIQFSSRLVYTILANLKLAETFEKIRLDEQTIEALKSPDGIKVDSNHNLVKLCKSIYRLSKGKVAHVLSDRGWQQHLFSKLFVKTNDYVDVFMNIKKIKCDEDNEFKKFQEEIKDYDIKQDAKRYFSFTEKPENTNNTKVINIKRCLSFISTIIFALFLLMLLLNALVDFISITIFWFVLLISIACIALGISFFINIKYEIIEFPECLGGNGFSINFYQNQEKDFSQHIIDSGFTEEEKIEELESDDSLNFL